MREPKISMHADARDAVREHVDLRSSPPPGDLTACLDGLQTRTSLTKQLLVLAKRNEHNNSDLLLNLSQA